MLVKTSSVAIVAETRLDRVPAIRLAKRVDTCPLSPEILTNRVHFRAWNTNYSLMSVHTFVSS